MSCPDCVKLREALEEAVDLLSDNAPDGMHGPRCKCLWHEAARKLVTTARAALASAPESAKQVRQRLGFPPTSEAEQQRNLEYNLDPAPDAPAEPRFAEQEDCPDCGGGGGGTYAEDGDCERCNGTGLVLTRDPDGGGGA